jgi:hypothetical protein
MLSHWGYIYFVIGGELAFAQTAVENYQRVTRNSLLDPKGEIANLVMEKCETIRRLSDEAKQELGAIPANIAGLQIRIIAERKKNALAQKLQATEVVDEIQRIRNDLSSILSERYFYYLSPGAAQLYGQPEAFGEKSQESSNTLVTTLSERETASHWEKALRA